MKRVFQVIFLLLLGLLLILIVKNYHKIPTKIQHITRNKTNILPVGKLILISNNMDEYYIDENNIKWKKRSFFRNLLHNPFKNYTFETYSPNDIYSSEASITIDDFDNGIMRFKPESFNYYSSYYSPVSHLFADILPIIIYINPDYKKYSSVY
jgi:hypothetical protein